MKKLILILALFVTNASQVIAATTTPLTCSNSKTISTIPYQSLFENKVSKVDIFFMDFDQDTSNGISDLIFTSSCYDSGFGTTLTTTTYKLKLQFINNANTSIYSVSNTTTSPTYTTSTYSISQCDVRPNQT